MSCFNREFSYLLVCSFAGGCFHLSGPAPTGIWGPCRNPASAVSVGRGGARKRSAVFAVLGRKRSIADFVTTRGFLGGGPTVSEAPPLGAEAEPEAHPLSRPLVPFGRFRKELALRRNLGRTISGAYPACRGGTRQKHSACRPPPAKGRRAGATPPLRVKRKKWNGKIKEVSGLRPGPIKGSRPSSTGPAGERLHSTPQWPRPPLRAPGGWARGHRPPPPNLPEPRWR